MRWLGLDIGGANLKLADGNGYADACPLELWRDQQQLTDKLRLLIAQAPAADHLAVTMTGELADCFQSKREGVGFILESIQRAADGRHTRVYLSSGQLVAPHIASERADEAAAANWHALAVFAARHASPGLALMVDVGSTTTDLILVLDGRVITRGRTDTTRLLRGELLYLGVGRTPICSLVDSVPYRDQMCPVARELFATTNDAYLILGDRAEDPTSRRTADGRPETKAAARARLGRMICADSSEFNHRDAVAVASAIADVVTSHLADAVRSLLGPRILATVVLSGEGEFVAQRVLKQMGRRPKLVSLSQEYSPIISRCAPAHALAVLARENAFPDDPTIPGEAANR